MFRTPVVARVIMTVVWRVMVSNSDSTEMGMRGRARKQDECSGQDRAHGNSSCDAGTTPARLLWRDWRAAAADEQAGAQLRQSAATRGAAGLAPRLLVPRP